MSDWARDSERDVDVVTGCYMLVRRAAMDEVGLLDERFYFCGEETDWCRRFRKAGWRVRFAPVGEIIHHGNASGRKHSFRRDVMLTAGLVRFHRKHHGLAGAAAAWGLLLVFNASRWGLWGIASLARRGRLEWRTRRDHFWGVLRHWGEVWPAES
jgi:GT2 family glycosyltransferase